MTKNFNSNEFSRSNTAKRLGIKNAIHPNHYNNLVDLCDNVLQPLRDALEVPIYISSGYRSAELNEAIGGAKKSQHCKGEAADIDQDRYKRSNADVFNYILNNLPFDQLIWEFGDDKEPAWVHVSFNKFHNRKEVLKAYKQNGKTRYEKIISK